MPMYLKRDTIRLLKATVESINMAVAAPVLPKQYELHKSVSENAIAIGLAGIIVQAKGERALRLPSGYYKKGTHIIDNFMALIASQIPNMIF